MSYELPKIRSLRAEIAFAVRRFNELSTERRRAILKQLRSGDKTVRTLGAQNVGGLLLEADINLLTGFMNGVLQTPFSAYLPARDGHDAKMKILMVGLYFINNLPNSRKTKVQEPTI